MRKKIRKSGVLGKVCMIPVYLCFFLVQLNVQNNQTASLPFFSVDVHHSDGNFHINLKQVKHRDAKPPAFRLNKRFQPVTSFSLPIIAGDCLLVVFNTRAFSPDRKEPVRDIHPGSHRLRGPPAVV